LSFRVVKAHVPENVIHKVKHFFVEKIESLRLVPILKQAPERRRWLLRWRCSRWRRCCRREQVQGLKRSSSLYHLLGFLFHSNALSTDNVAWRFLSPKGKDTNKVSGAEHVCRIQPFRNLTSVTMYSPKPRQNRALKWYISKPRPWDVARYAIFPNPAHGTLLGMHLNYPNPA